MLNSPSNQTLPTTAWLRRLCANSSTGRPVNATETAQHKTRQVRRTQKEKKRAALKKNQRFPQWKTDCILRCPFTYPRFVKRKVEPSCFCGAQAAGSVWYRSGHIDCFQGWQTQSYYCPHTWHSSQNDRSWRKTKLSIEISQCCIGSEG